MHAFLRDTGCSIEGCLENGQTAGFPYGFGLARFRASQEAREWALANGAKSIEERGPDFEVGSVMQEAIDYLTECGVPASDIEMGNTVREVDEGYWVSIEVYVTKSRVEG